MLKIDNEGEIYSLIHKALRQTISTHGVIHQQLVSSATKRILGAIKTHLYECKIRSVKRIRVNDKYVEIEKTMVKGNKRWT